MYSLWSAEEQSIPPAGVVPFRGELSASPFVVLLLVEEHSFRVSGEVRECNSL